MTVPAPSSAHRNARAFVNRDGRSEAERARRREKIAAIESRRRDAKVSVETMCGHAGLAASTWWRALAGSLPRPATLRRIVRALDAIERDTFETRDL